MKCTTYALNEDDLCLVCEDAWLNSKPVENLPQLTSCRCCAGGPYWMNC